MKSKLRFAVFFPVPLRLFFPPRTKSIHYSEHGLDNLKYVLYALPVIEEVKDPEKEKEK
ncbi:MAG: hypothetical protein N3D11_15215 [Candidatus Sumerlaeia bacterium]|nr:hypothetical protein [Candidatus Sumerlaeia bacterium]